MRSIGKVIADLSEKLNPRQREVVLARFGLHKTAEPQTLAALGDRYGITRERVRQIESSALEALRGAVTEHPVCVEFIDRSARYLKDAGGVAKEDSLLNHHASEIQGVTPNHLAFLRDASGAFHRYPEDRTFWTFYYLGADAMKAAMQFLHEWIALVENKKREVLDGRYHEHFRAFARRKELKEQHATHFVAISKIIHTNPYGDIGLIHWPEILPRTIRDRIYLALKKKEEPMHFRDITEAISENDFGLREASAPTVHNELIKDDRFVLVGRGIYALREHGYEPGTAREVIARVLRDAGPLRLNEIIKTIARERFFKPNTILVNLQNKRFFRRLQDGTYEARR